MAKYRHFEDLPVWQEAVRLYNEVLDLLEMPGVAFTPGFRGQLDRAALSVSNNIAEGFERMTTGELLAFLAIARGSAGETRSMIAAVIQRPRLAPHRERLQVIRQLAESCLKQVTAWMSSIEESPVQGKRHLTGPQRAEREHHEKAREFRLQFLRSLKPSHPLYPTPEARAARGEPPLENRQ
jgi:four helix bundle protein